MKNPCDGPARYIIAASDSVNPERANLICDGTHDEDDVITAIALVNEGAEIYMLEGTYHIDPNGTTHPEIVLNKRIHINCDGKWLLGGSAGLAGLVLGATGTPITAAQVYIHEVDGVAKANNRDFIRVENARNCEIHMPYVHDCRYAITHAQSNPANVGAENIFYYDLIKLCTKGYYMPAACWAWHEGNQLHGGAMFNTEVCVDIENGSHGGGMLITGVLDGAFDGGNPAWIDYRNQGGATELGNLLLMKFIRLDVIHTRDVIIGIDGAGQGYRTILGQAFTINKSSVLDWSMAPASGNYLTIAGSPNALGGGTGWAKAGALQLNNTGFGANSCGFDAIIAKDLTIPNYPFFRVMLLKSNATGYEVAGVDEYGQIRSKRNATLTVGNGTNTATIADANANAGDILIVQLDAGGRELGQYDVTINVGVSYVLTFQNNATANRSGYILIIRRI